MPRNTLEQSPKRHSVRLLVLTATSLHGSEFHLAPTGRGEWNHHYLRAINGEVRL